MRWRLHIPVSLLARTMLFIGLAAVTLFVVGPLAGSVDDDGDGSPDIPVVVSDSVFFCDLSADKGVDQRAAKIRHGDTSDQFEIASPGRELIECPSLALDVCSVLQSCSLRC